MHLLASLAVGILFDHKGYVACFIACADWGVWTKDWYVAAIWGVSGEKGSCYMLANHAVGTSGFRKL